MVSMSRLIFGSCLYLALGCYILWFARKTARDPGSYITKWQSWLPKKRWAYRVVRILTMVWIFAALLMITEAPLQFLPIWRSYASHFTSAVLIALALITLLLVPKQDRDPPSDGHSQ